MRNFDEQEERFSELTKNVIQIVHPLLNPLISTPEQAMIDYFNHPLFHAVCRSIVAFIVTEKPDAEEQLLQTIEIENLLKQQNIFLRGI